MAENELAAGMVLAQPIRSYEDEDGFHTYASKPYPVPRPRFAELKANGLVLEAEGEKAAPEPDNKAAPEAQNRAAPKPQDKGGR